MKLYSWFFVFLLSSTLLAAVEKIEKLGEFDITLVSSDTEFLGLGQIVMGDWVLRDATCPSWLPATQTRQGVTYQQWKLTSIDRTVPNQITIHMQSEGVQSLLQHEENVYGHAFVVGSNDLRSPQPAVGAITIRTDVFDRLPLLKVQMSIEVSEGDLDWLLDRHSWRPSGDLSGWRYFSQRWGTENGGWDSSLDDVDGFTTIDAMHVHGKMIVLGQGQPRGFGGPALDFVYGPSGAIALWRDPQEPGAYIRAHVTKQMDQDFVGITDQYFVKRTQKVQTPWLHIVVNKSVSDRRHALNWWTVLWDHYGDTLRGAAGVPEPAPVPTVILESWSLKSGRWFEHQTAQLDELAARGIQRVVMHTLPHPHIRRNNCAHFNYSIAEYEGGMKALRSFTDAARERGIEVYGWGGGSLYAKAPILKDHPDRTIQNADGRRFHGGYPGTLVAVDFANHEFQNLYVEQLTALHKEGGIAGMWLDSWMNLHAFGIDHDRDPAYGGPGPHLDGLLSCLKRLSDEGMRFITEGVSPIGLSAGNLGRGFTKEAANTGNIDLDAIHHDGDGHFKLLYRSSMWWRGHHRAGGIGLSADEYFASIANKAPVALYDQTIDHPPQKLGTMELVPVAFEEYAEMNRAYSSVLPELVRRELITDGILWHKPSDSNSVILFANNRPLKVGESFAKWKATAIHGSSDPAVDDNGMITVGNRSIVRLSAP